jgi:hypothetical protein
MREELGVAEEYRRLMENSDSHTADFPGIDGKRVVQAILDGQLRIGNPEQPHVKCWNGPVTYVHEATQPSTTEGSKGYSAATDDPMIGFIRHIIDDTLGE